MTECNKCGSQNKDYYNYCSNDGENLSSSQSRLTLRERTNAECECGAVLKSAQNYCPNCGKLISEIGMRTNTRRNISGGYKVEPSTSTEKKIDEAVDDFKDLINSLPVFFEKITSTLKHFDFAGFTKNNIPTATKIALIAMIATCVWPLITTMISLAVLSSDDFGGMEVLYALKYMGLSGPKMFLMSLVGMSVPKNIIAISASSVVKVGISARTIIAPILAAGCIVAGIRIMFKEKKYNALPLAVLSALVYSLIMAVISLLARYTITESGEMMTIHASMFSVIINSFIISFVAIMVGLEGENSKKLGTISNIFKHNYRIVEGMLLGIAIVLMIYTYVKMNSMSSSINDMYGYSYAYVYNYVIQELLSSETGFFLFIGLLILFIFISPYLLLFMQFVSFKIFITSFNIISGGTFLLTTLIPIVMFILIGRNIKTRYGEGRVNIVTRYSLCYTSIMFLLSYFSRISFSGNVSELSSELSYFSSVLGSVSAAGYLGMSSLMTIIVTFIFSIVFMYVGYKTKKVNQ